MKHLFLLLFGFFLLVQSSLFAQVTEGHISYSIEVSTNDPQMEMVIGMMAGSTMEMYFAKDRTRLEINMGTIMKVTTITNTQANKMLTLMSGINGQNAMTSEINAAEDQLDNSSMQVTLVDETKVLHNYTCKKAILTDDEGNESTYWYTTEINIAKQGQNYLKSEVPGFPLQFEINDKGMRMSLTVIDLKEELGYKQLNTLFDQSIPEGYTVMSPEDLKMMGQ